MGGFLDTIKPFLGPIGSVVEGAFSAYGANRQMDFQRDMSNTSHQREVQDLIKAGLNPMLSARLGGASSPPGASMPTPRFSESANSAALLRSQIKLNESGAAKNQGETLSPGVADQVALANAGSATQAAATGRSSASQMDQHTRNLQAELEKIAAEVELLRSEKNVKDKEPALREAETRVRRIEAQAKELEIPVSSARGGVGDVISKGLSAIGSGTQMLGSKLGGWAADLRDEIKRQIREDLDDQMKGRKPANPRAKGYYK